MKPIQHISLQEYLSAPGVAKHDLDAFAKSPEHYHNKLNGLVPNESTEAMRLGSALHSLVLEGRREFVEKPTEYINKDGALKPWNGNSNDCKQWLVENEGKTIVSRAQREWMEQVCEILSAPPEATRFWADGEPEVSLLATDPETGLLLKTRPDWHSAKTGIWMDLKTCTDASTDAFNREIYNRRYHVQAALQRKIANILGIRFEEYWYIAVEKSNPPMVNIRRLSPMALDLGEFKLNDELNALKECIETSTWPGYTGTEVRRDFDVPAFAYAALDNLMDRITIGGKEIKL